MAKSIDLVINPKNSAVMLIDMQEKAQHFFDKYYWQELVENHLAVLKFCRRKDVPVYLLEMETYGKTVKPLWDEFVQVPRAAFLFREYNNGFCRSDATKVLKQWDIKNVFVCGINATYCVLGTAHGARKNFYVATADNVIADNPGFYIFTGEVYDPEPKFKNEGVVYLDDYRSYFRTRKNR